MFLRATRRKKDGKEHRYWSVVENRRVRGGRTVQKTLLYLGELKDSQQAGGCRTIAAIDERQTTQLAFFPDDRTPPPDVPAVQVQLAQLVLQRPRQWGACWLAMELWARLQLDTFWAPRLPALAGRHRVAPGPQDAGGLSPDRSRERVAAPPSVV